MMPQSAGPWLLMAPDDPLASLLAADRQIAGFVYRAADLPPDAASVLVMSQELLLAEGDRLAVGRAALTVVLRDEEPFAEAPGRRWRLAALMARDPRLAGRVIFASAEPELLSGAAEFAGFEIAPLKLATDPAGRATAVLVDDACHISNEVIGPTQSLPAADVSRPRFLRRLTLADRTGLTRQAAEANRLLSRAAPRPAVGTRVPQAVLMIVPNGVGLGHMTRLLAVARALRQLGIGAVEFWCYSRAARLIAEAGFTVYPRQTAEHLEAPFDDWCHWETHDLAEAIRARGVGAVVQDGSRLGAALLGALDLPGTSGTRLVWVRRGMWQAHADTAPIDEECLADLVLEPGDLAAAADRGATRHHRPAHRGFARRHDTPPAIATLPGEVLPRAQARRKLGLPRRARIVLLNLGGNALTDHAVLRDALGRAGDGFVFFAARSPFHDGPGLVGDGLAGRRLYPVAPYLAAFDGVVSAAGYNSFHEALLLSAAPLLLAPTLHGRLDDQLARAQFAAEAGWAELFDANRPEAAAAALSRFLDAVAEGRRAPRPEAECGGAEAMARHIADLLAGRAQEATKVRLRG